MNEQTHGYRILLSPAKTVRLNGYQDCNIPGVWIADQYRTFHGTFHRQGSGRRSTAIYKEGRNVIEAMTGLDSKPYYIKTDENLTERPGIGMWIEAIYQPEPNGLTLYGMYHNENTMKTLQDPEITAHAASLDSRNITEELITVGPIIRIGMVKSTDGGEHWEDLGIILKDHYKHFMFLPHLLSCGYIGGTTDPSWVDGRDGYLYIFFTETSNPEEYDPQNYDPAVEASGQGISCARILKSDLDQPIDEYGNSKVWRWDGSGFHSPGYYGVSKPIKNLMAQDSSALSQNLPHMNWGPSICWNKHLDTWTMLMTHACRRLYRSDVSFVSFFTGTNLSDPTQWTVPVRCTPTPAADTFPFFPVFQSEACAPNYESTVELGRHARFFTVECTVDTDINHSTMINRKVDDTYLCISAYAATFVRPDEQLPCEDGQPDAFASSCVDAEHGAERMIDGNMDTYWQAGDSLFDPAWVVLDLGQEREVTKLSFAGVEGIDRARLQVWNRLARQDKGCVGDWADLGFVSISLTGPSSLIIEPVTTRYIRLVVTNQIATPRIALMSAE